MCESDTKETIELTSDIIVDEPVVIRGEKIIHGRDIIWFGVLCMGKFMVDVCF